MAMEADGQLAKAKATCGRRLDVGHWVEGKVPGSLEHQASLFLSLSLQQR